MTTINERIAALRKEHAMTQEELASVIGVSAQSVSKWENSVTMPDIQLLPVLAGVFGVTVDELFSDRKPQPERTYPLDDVPEECYRAFLEALQGGWRHGEDDLSILPLSIAEHAANIATRLQAHPEQQTGLISRRAGSVYANHELALIYRPNKEESLPLLDDEAAAGLLRAFASPAFRRILKWQLTNPGMSYTASSVASKCGLAEPETQEALDALSALTFIMYNDVDVGTETPLRVYSANRMHLMPLLVYPLLSLAKRLATIQENWCGFRC